MTERDMPQPNMEPDTRELLAALDAATRDGRLSRASLDNLRPWLTEPYYAEYRDAVAQHIRDRRFAELDAAFFEIIPFGTGGRRGRMADFGTATINTRTMGESAQGLADYLRKSRVESRESRETAPSSRTSAAQGKRESSRPDSRPSSLDSRLKAAVAYDTRHRSEEFARLAAEVLAANGLEVALFDAPRSTPELSFAVRRLGCDAGAMISASHNPPSDNGIKCYWSGGQQVLPPHDAGIIECVKQARDVRRMDFEQAVAAGRIRLVDEEMDRAYCAAVLAQGMSAARGVRILFSPVHGVGETSVYRVLREAGFEAEVLEFQRRPDGNFTNVPDHLPNPERPEVLMPACAAAAQIGAELVLASDPDADRLAAAVPAGQGRWTYLTGNQTAALLTDYCLGKLRARGELTPEHYVVETLVTTELVWRIAEGYAARCIRDLLVGFKYIAQAMDREGPERFVFAAEESYGYLKGSYVRDKDAAVAALLLAELAAELKQQGRRLTDRLDDLYLAHGYHVEMAASRAVPGPAGLETVKRVMGEFRLRPPRELADVALAEVHDYGQHEVRSLPENRRRSALEQPRGSLLIFRSGDGDLRFAVRPSGTEPKIKFYFFGRGVCPSRADLASVRQATDARLAAVRAALLGYVDAALRR